MVNGRSLLFTTVKKKRQELLQGLLNGSQERNEKTKVKSEEGKRFAFSPFTFHPLIMTQKVQHNQRCHLFKS